MDVLKLVLRRFCGRERTRASCVVSLISEALLRGGIMEKRAVPEMVANVRKVGRDQTELVAYTLPLVRHEP